MRSAGLDEKLEVDSPRFIVRGEVGHPFNPQALWELAERAEASASEIYTFFCEAVSNVYSHAYPKLEHRSEWLGWEARVSIDTDRIVFSVRDQGVGIASSMQARRGSETLDPHELIRLAVIASADVGRPGRGRGLSGMVDLARRRSDCIFDVQSSGLLLSFGDAAPEGRGRIAWHRVGTVISISMPCDALKSPSCG